MPPTSDDEAQIVRLIAEFVDQQVRPAVRELEQSDTYPERLIEQMKSMGVFGLTVPPPHGSSHVSTRCFALVTEELARGWMSLAGAFGGHAVVAHLIARFGTPDQQQEYLPRLATGELRATMALTEPDGGSDLQAIRTVARRDRGGWIVNGTKTWISNARHAELIAVLSKTDPDAHPAHLGISILLVEQSHGVQVSRDLSKLGYKGVESCELSFQDVRVPDSAVLGTELGRGFGQMMSGLELGRIQVAARAIGVARAAFDDSLRYSQLREAFGKPIWKHQSVGNYLAESATKITAARLLNLHAAECLDSGRRADLEAGMAKLYASEIALETAIQAMRVHGGYGYSTELDVERYYRDAPLMIIGEGTNEIQRNVIARQLIERGGLGW